VTVTIASGASLGCDAGPFHDQPTVGPPINLVAAGTNIESGHGYTLDQPIRLAFDRFLDPRTVTRQSISVEDSSGRLLTDPLMAYDPVTLTVTISNPGETLGWLTAGQQYRVVINVPGYEGGTPDGLQAIDGATLAAPMTLLFKAGAAAEPPFDGIPQMDFCADIFKPIFLQNCAFARCHAPTVDAGITALDAGETSLGLNLSTPSQVQATAIGQIADESNTGPVSTTQSWPLGTPFGIDMNVITPQEPGNSWMLYKTLLALPSPAALAYDYKFPGVSTYGSSVASPISQAELGRLSNYVLGQSMPYPSPAVAEPSVSTLAEADLVRLSAWIAQGAPTASSCP
jgi:hypothetical protein